MNGLTFRIGTADYKVVEKPDLMIKHNLLGQITYHDARIEVEPTLCDQRKASVIIHELVHAMLYEAGYDEHDEDQVVRLGNVLTQVLRDNSFDILCEEEDVE
ncbi:ImmA/IrrE family metallo-endopeptidase [Bacillus sp. Y1]|nr:ImmA/IrrE family metallo-endopeptidase [Bacillus sp. Y1]AYA77359.1 ImmA/IrrE family metallo-endopeptidase [Bacillus sp. Y1]